MRIPITVIAAAAAALIPLVPVPAAAAGQVRSPRPAAVVINEIFYNAPDDLDQLQWIELHNPGDRAADLSGWVLDGGKSYVFGKGTTIPPRGYLVVALNPEQFRKSYAGVPAVGPLKRPLDRGGERIELSDGARKRVDVARYKDAEPWPVSADGYAASLERISPSAPGDGAENWAASPLPAGPARPAGTPGKRNAGFSQILPPVIRAVNATPEDPRPGDALRVEAELKGGGQGAREVALLYRTVTAAGGAEGAETVLPMTRDAANGPFRASIPAQPAGTLVRYRVRATGENGARRLFPDPNDLRPTRSAYVHEPWERAKIPFALVLRGGADRPKTTQENPFRQPRPGRPGGFLDFMEVEGEGGPGGPFGPPPGGPPGAPPPRDGARPRGARPPGARPASPRQARPAAPRPSPRGAGRGGPGQGPDGGPPPDFDFRAFMGREAPDTPRPARGTSTLIFVDEKTGKTSVFDYVHVPSRDRGPMYRGFKVFLHKDRPLNQMTAVNLVLEGSEWSLLAEALAYDLYRTAGSAAPEAEFVRVWVDGRLDGYHLLVERPNRAFLRRNGIDDRGDLYKLLWYGRDLVDQHEKKTNTRSGGHKDLVALVDRLRKTKGDAQWKVIEEHFNVDQVATYFAVNMILSHWDGFFNNYFTYHDTRGTGKWEIYPWDQDKTWGYHDALGDNDDVFFDLPLTFGMAGDRPPRAASGPAASGRPELSGPFAMGGPMWWRPAGHFSGPLLANPRFRKVFLLRTRELLERVYTPEAFFPRIDAMADRLKEDVVLRAKARGEDADAGTRALARNVELFKAHLVKRREFLLRQPELRAAGDASGPASAAAAKFPGDGQGAGKRSPR